ncbi:endo alpha-1,4 polygalactosaminidase [Sandaracinus amylolyticus]|uniref:Glycoside-hydrolase family GH114 TIM-barrel domain-containing protein n=1 Tax=Sandaracinus amylolyticus TaxID=927083 RepID=A0A0F6SDY1_9BACT|nr:endo alpha-1,4 polygalactosaminidase [Sandaracinus amylolyticus]AKF04234.1 hypothetical protein DB32_001383 [Sandaracinus amylolyticus]
MKRLGIAIVVLGLSACGGDDDDGATPIDAAVPDAAVMDGATRGPDAARPGDDAATARDGGSADEPRLPPANAGFDYQLGGAYAPPSGVQIVSRDRTEALAEGLYNLCYVNGFQAQPDASEWWLAEHPDLVLRDASGDPVIDRDWDEMLLDTRTPEKRAALAEIVGGWIEQCADDGFDAIEIDNLDSYARSEGLLTQDQAVAFMRLLSDVAHGRGLAIAQKNSTELLARRDEMGTDFAVAEECNRYDECGDYVDAYGDGVLVIEYREADFTAGCADFPDLSIVLRDLDLVPLGEAGYVRDDC